MRYQLSLFLNRPTDSVQKKLQLQPGNESASEMNAMSEVDFVGDQMAATKMSRIHSPDLI